jgi:uncharacterized small protein (DUF1192 family)
MPTKVERKTAMSIKTKPLYRFTRKNFGLVEAIDSDHERHEEFIDWLGDDFDPEAFSVDEVNQRLALLQQRRKKTAARKT